MCTYLCFTQFVFREEELSFQEVSTVPIAPPASQAHPEKTAVLSPGHRHWVNQENTKAMHVYC